MSGRTMRNRTPDWRRWHRVELSVPAEFRRDPGTSGAFSVLRGQTVNLSASGVYLTTAPIGVKPGDVLSVSIAIPWDQRQSIPFSRIAGPCRVIRVDHFKEGGDEGLALAFCEDRLIQLGTIIGPS